MIHANCKKILYRTVLLFSFLFTGSLCFAQTFVTKATVSKNKILIGEQLFLAIEVTAATDQTQVIPIIDTIPHF
jgi:hypothetical protein